MGYNITIGNAETEFDKEWFPELSARWVVGTVENDDAPVFKNDEMTGKSNCRSPSYTTWSDFTKSAGLHKLFFGDEQQYKGLMAQHPGCVGITQEDADVVTAALNKYKSMATLPPGFEEGWVVHEGPPNYDYTLARLIWLEYWMQWAVKNCDTPAIWNT